MTLTPEAERRYRSLGREDRRRLARNAPVHLRPHLAALERRMQAERSPADLARVITGGRELQARHLDLIGDAFAGIDSGAADRVGLFMPPRHGKSRRVRWGILWYLMRHPDRRIIVASYAQTLAEAHGRWLRDTIEAHHDVLGFRLRASSHAAARWDIEGTEGGLLAVGVGGGSTGHGASLFVIDDPVKDSADAESLTMQQRAWDWWQAVAQTRLEPDGSVVLIQTRWSPGDLGGRILADDPQSWRTVDLPAIAMHPDEYRAINLDPVPDPLGRAPGEALWPERYDAERLARIRRSVGERVWWALYQQQPRPPEGALLTRDELYAARTLSPTATPVRHAVAVDPSGGGRDTAGIVAGWLGDDQRLYITHDRTGRMPSGEWARAACVLAHETSADLVVVEANFGGDMAKLALLTAWDALEREGAVKGVPPSVREVRAKKGKLLRAEPIAGQWREDRIRTTAVMPQLEHEWCIAAGERVTTHRGDVPIEDVRVGDEVWTRMGWKPVQWSGRTGIKETLTIQTDAGTLRCTPNHEVFVDGKGFIPALEVEAGDRIQTCLGVLGSRTLTSTDGATSRPAMATGRPTEPSKGSQTTGPCTGPSGRSTTAASPTGTTSSTSTGTAPTTLRTTSRRCDEPAARMAPGRTSSASTRYSPESATTSSPTATTRLSVVAPGRPGTTCCTGQCGPQPTGPSLKGSTSTTSTTTSPTTTCRTCGPSAVPPTSATTSKPSQLAGVHGIAKPDPISPRTGGAERPLAKSSANGVAPGSSRPDSEPDTAVPDAQVQRHGVGTPSKAAPGTSTGPVSNAGPHTRPGLSDPDTAPSCAALVLAVTAGRLSEPVYDLTVADAHEFYVNGLLVHNCSWLPTSTDSPGRIDASVYLAYALLRAPADPVGAPAARQVASRNLLSGLNPNW